MDPEKSGRGSSKTWLPYFLPYTDDCFTHPRGAREAFGKKCNAVTGNGRAKPCSTSSLIIDQSTLLFLIADWWFPRLAWKIKSFSLSSGDILLRGNDTPFDRILQRWIQKGCWSSSSSRSSWSRNSEPYEIWLGCCFAIIWSRLKPWSARTFALYPAAAGDNWKRNSGGFIGGEAVAWRFPIISTNRNLDKGRWVFNWVASGHRGQRGTRTQNGYERVSFVWEVSILHWVATVGNREPAPSRGL